jgi:hypothetical protein
MTAMPEVCNWPWHDLPRVGTALTETDVLQHLNTLVNCAYDLHNIVLEALPAHSTTTMLATVMQIQHGFLMSATELLYAWQATQEGPAAPENDPDVRVSQDPPQTTTARTRSPR